MAENSLTTEQQELLAMLAGELQALLENSLSQSQSNCTSPQLQETADALNNFANAAELMGLQGLARAWRCLAQNFQAMSVEDFAITPDQVFLVDSWIIYFLDFLQQFSECALVENNINSLVEFLTNPSWPLALSDAEKAQLTQELLSAEVTLADDESQRLPTTATLDMLSLRLSGDINPELFEGLMIELPTQVAQFSEQLAIFIRQRERAALASAQRIAHTIKGAANVVGISGLANFMHFSEDLLEEIAKHDEALTPALSNLLVDMGDTLATMLDNLSAGENNVGELELCVMQQVLDAYHSIHSGGFASFISSQVIPVAAHSTALDEKPTIESDKSQEAHAEQPQQLQETLAAHLRIKEDTAQDLLRLAGESAIFTNRLQTQVQDVKSQLLHIGSLHNKLTQLTEEFGHLIEVRELFSSRAKKMHGDSDLDPLELDRYNELHSFFHQLQEFAIDTRDAIYQTQGQLRDLEDLTFEQQVTNRASQNHLLEMRMIPASNLEARFQRCVRQACRLTGKQARFVLRGGNTMIDSRVLHELVDPLMHLLRNAVDHGIEDIYAREDAGKNSEGFVELQFAVQNQSIVVRVLDDGAGLHHESILRKAQELSLTPPTDANPEITELWLKQIIFAAGFSTRDQVSQTSGRGIGLDMVADRVAALKGRITVDSKPGQGCEFSIRLPMPMITEQGLLVACGKHRLAISARGVEQLLFLEESALTNHGDQLRYRFNQQEIEVFHIAQLARLPDEISINTMDAHALLVVETIPGQRAGVLVERVMASREIVVKPLTQFTPQVSGVIGATILGDGAVAPVIDVQHLVLNLLQSGGNSSNWLNENMRISQQHRADKPMALIVDDSLSTRRSLAQFVGDLGMDVCTAKDGFEAIEILQEQTPQLMLVDMEMPRMNGLELTAHVRANETTRHIPIIMITSRNTEKHRSLASAAGVDTYLNKPFSEEELLHHIQENMQV